MQGGHSMILSASSCGRVAGLGARQGSPPYLGGHRSWHRTEVRIPGLIGVLMLLVLWVATALAMQEAVFHVGERTYSGSVMRPACPRILVLSERREWA
jgi:hypothetical protein